MMKTEDLKLVKDWDKTFKKSDKVEHKKSNDGWNTLGCISFMNQPILKYSNEIRSSVLIIHGEKAHSCYFFVGDVVKN